MSSRHSGEAVQRLRDEQSHILELFDAYAGHRRDTESHVADTARVATRIYTLLRVHCELETMLLDSSMKDQLNFRAAAADVATQRSAMLDALERVEAVSHRDQAHVHKMETLALRVRAWFQAGERLVFGLEPHSCLDLVALDAAMAKRQEAMRSADTTVPRAAQLAARSRLMVPRR